MSALLKALPIVAPVYAKKFGVRVKIGGTRAKTDGDVIHLPSVPLDYPVPEALYGFLAHEGSHVRSTEFKCFAEAKKSGDGVKHILNIIEDGRIETDIIREFPGTAASLDRALAFFIEQGRITAPTQDEGAMSIFMAYLLFWMRWKWRAQVAAWDPYEQSRTLMLDNFGDDFVGRLDALLEKGPGCATTRECLNLTYEIVELVKEQEPEEDDSDESESGESGENGEQNDDGDGESESEPQEGDEEEESSSGSQNGGDDDESESHSGEGEGEGESESDPEEGDDEGKAGSGSSQGDEDDESESSGGEGGDESESNPDKGDGKGKSSSQKGDDDEGDESESNSGESDSNSQSGEGQNQSDAQSQAAKELSEALSDMSEEEIEDLIKDFAEIMKEQLEDDYDAESELLHAATQGLYGGGIYSTEVDHQGIVSNAKTATSGLRRQVRRLVETRVRRQTRMKDSGQRLAADRLAGVAAGKTRVFRHRSKESGFDTHVEILIDVSGSMREGSPKAIETAKEAAVGLSLALDEIRGVKVGVRAFNTESKQLISAQTSLKPQLEALTSVYPTGGTVFTYPLMESMRELSQTRSQGKVLIMITDGCVNNVEDIASSAKIVSSGEKGGVQCIGIGVGNTSVKQIFANAVELNSSATNLASVLFDRTQKILDVA